MARIVASINMSLDGFCDHTAMTADEQLHQHYTDLLRNSGAILYGRITYQLMESHWPLLVKNPSGIKHNDDFALAIEDIPKILFSRSVNKVGWTNVRLATRDLKDEVQDLRKQEGKDILVGSRSLIVALTNLNLIDEYQLCVHPVIAGSGLPLFKSVSDRTVLKLLRTKSFGTGVIVLYYVPTRAR